MIPKSVTDRCAQSDKIETLTSDSADDAAVSTRTAEEMPERLRRYRWHPGQSGNPGGRMSALARRVRQATHDGQDLVDFLVAVASDPSERTRDRLHAAEMLLSRGWGRPLLPLLIEPSGREEVTTHKAMEVLLRLRPEVLEEIVRVTSALPPPAVDGAGGS
jgi:hypothetical protein